MDPGLKAFERLTIREKWERVLEPVITMGVERGVLPIAIVCMQTAPDDGQVLVGNPLVVAIGEHPMVGSVDGRTEDLAGLFAFIAESYASGHNTALDHYDVDFGSREG